jgi:cold shock CspA family protein
LAFIHAKVVEKSGFGPIYDGDDLLCDIERNSKGLAVSQIHEVQEAKSDVYIATVVKLFSERYYGFVNVPDVRVDAFFHYHLVNPEELGTLSEGKQLTVEIKTDRQGRSQVRRVLGVVE